MLNDQDNVDIMNEYLRRSNKKKLRRDMILTIVVLSMIFGTLIAFLFYI